MTTLSTEPRTMQNTCDTFGPAHGANGAHGAPIKDISVRVSELMAIGKSMMLLRQFDEALEHLSTALRMVQNTGDKITEVRLFIKIGDILYFQNNFSKASQHFEQGRRMATAIGAHKEMGDAYCGLGGVNRAERVYDRAIEHFQAGLRIFETHGLRGSAASVCGELGAMYGAMDQSATSREYFAKVYSMVAPPSPSRTNPLRESCSGSPTTHF